MHVLEDLYGSIPRTAGVVQLRRAMMGVCSVRYVFVMLILRFNVHCASSSYGKLLGGGAFACAVDSLQEQKGQCWRVVDCSMRGRHISLYWGKCLDPYWATSPNKGL